MITETNIAEGMVIAKGGEARAVYSLYIDVITKKPMVYWTTGGKRDRTTVKQFVRWARGGELVRGADGKRVHDA